MPHLSNYVAMECSPVAYVHCVCFIYVCFIKYMNSRNYNELIAFVFYSIAIQTVIS